MRGRGVLRSDAVFLFAAGLFGVVSDLQSYASGTGPFGHTFHQNPTVIGVVEAHSLAVLVAVSVWCLAHTPRFGHWVALAAHLIMGTSNIIWFDVFRNVNAATQGVAVTVVHFVFVILNTFFLIRNARTRN